MISVKISVHHMGFNFDIEQQRDLKPGPQGATKTIDELIGQVRASMIAAITTNANGETIKR